MNCHTKCRLGGCLFLLCCLALCFVAADDPPSNFCSGTVRLTAQTGVITDHEGGGHYRHNSRCIWQIQLDPEQTNQIDLRLTKLDLEFLYDYVSIYKGLEPTSASQIVWRTGERQDTSQEDPIVVPGANATVFFFADLMVSHSGFALTYAGVNCPDRCSGNGFCNMDNECECKPGWTGDSCNVGNCQQDGCSEAAGGGVCNNQTGQCECNVGFYGPTCSDPYCQPLSLIRANTGVISDHKTTGDSLHNLKCKWDIAAEDFDPEADRLPGDTTIEIEFSQFDLERDYDFVRISDGKTDAELHSVAVYTGTFIPPPAFATSGRMALEFTTDQGITRTGFQAHFTASSCAGGCSGHGYCFDGTCHCDHGFTGTNCEQTKCEGDCGLHGTCNDTRQICDCEVGFSGADCSLCDKEQASECQTEYCTGVVTLKDQSGSFASHTGGGLYHPGSLCTWQIRPSTEEAFDSIIVTFDELFELELNKAFISAVDASNHVIARYTGGTKPAPIVTRDKRLTITFTADSNAATALGFHARYTTLKCNDSCSGHGVCLPTGCNCDLGWTGDNCNMTECSDPNCSGNGECIDDKCVCKPGFFGPSCATTHCSGVTELGAASGTFRDHSQGLQYIPNSNCVWVIKPVPTSETVTLHFTKFRLDSLTNDVVRVYEGESVNDDRLLLSHTGSFTPMPVVSQSGSMLVQFTSDSHLPQSPELTGFVAEYFSGASCPNACSSRGYCLDGSCVCFGAFAGSDCSRAAEATPITIGSTTVGSVEFLQWKYYQLEIPDPPPFQLQIQLTETAKKRQTDSENNRAQTRLYLNRGALPTPSKADLVDHTVDDIKYIYVRQPASGTWYLGVEGHNDEGATTFSIDIAYSCPPSCENGGECDEELFICRCVHCYGGPDCTGVNQEACGPNAVCVDDACACQEGFNGYAPFCGISEEDDDGGGGSSAAVAIVVVLILLIFFAFAMGGAFWFLRHKAEQQRRAPVTISGRAPPATAAGATPPVAAATSAPPPLQPRSEPEFDEEEGEEMEGMPSKQRKGGYAQFY